MPLAAILEGSGREFPARGQNLFAANAIITDKLATHFTRIALEHMLLVHIAPT